MNETLGADERTLSSLPAKSLSSDAATSEVFRTGTGADSRSNRRRIFILASHVIQYSSPMFRRMAQDPRLDLLVIYCTLQGAKPSIDPAYGVEVAWDTSVLEGYPWVHLPNRSPIPGLGRFFGLFNPGLWKVIGEGDFEAAILPGYFYCSAWIAILASRWYGIPILFVTDAHSLDSWSTQSSWKLRLKKWAVSRIFSLAQAVVVSSSGGVEYLKSLGYPRNHVVLAPTAVDNAWWTEQAAKTDRATARDELQIPRESLVVLFCGTLQPWKAPADLIEAFARAKVPGSYLVFAGDGPLLSSLNQRAQELGIKTSVRFLGFVNQSRLPSVYRAADLLVLPSRFDAFGLVVNEAMLCGLPVAISDRVGARFDIVKPAENGYVFPVGDVDALSAILKEILPDEAKRERMGSAALRRMETWSPREYVEGFVRAINIVSSE